MLPIILAMEAEDQRSRMVEIYDHYGPFVYQCIGDYFQDFQRKEDLFQEVFKRLIERAEVVEILPHRQLRHHLQPHQHDGLHRSDRLAALGQPGRLLLQRRQLQPETARMSPLSFAPQRQSPKQRPQGACDDDSSLGALLYHCLLAPAFFTVLGIASSVFKQGFP